VASHAAELNLSYAEEKDLIKACLKRAFATLRSRGYIARMNFLCCASCAGAELANRVAGMSVDKRARVRGGIFYDRQDGERLEGGFGFSTLYINYGEIVTGTPEGTHRTPVPSVEVGKELVAVLEAEGLEVEWSGNPDHSVKLIGVGPALLAAYRVGGHAALPKFITRDQYGRVGYGPRKR
jgi:hypothetical protein